MIYIIYTNFMVDTHKNINSNENLDDALRRPWEGRAILHMDLDAFFAAVAQKDNPELQGKPVIVGGDPAKRGVVSTASYEARKFGVHSAMSSSEAQRRCPEGIWVHTDFARYKELSAQVIEFVYEHTPFIERTSIDECYADITPGRGLNAHPIAVARCIQNNIENLGLSASIGISSNKTTSKIGSDFLKPRGLTIIWPGDEARFLAPLPIEKLGGIGRSMAKKLHELNIKTLGDLAQCDAKSLSLYIGSAAASLIERAQGKDFAPVCVERETKSVSNERTFEHDLTYSNEILAELMSLCEKVCWRLRSDNLFGKTVTLKLKFPDFAVKTISFTLESSTNADSVICDTVRRLYLESGHVNHAIRLLGVGVSNFCEPVLQLPLFETEKNALAPQPDEEKLLTHLDEIREKFGYDSIGKGNNFL